MSSWISWLRSNGAKRTILAQGAIRTRWLIVLGLVGASLSGALAEAQDPAREASQTARQKPELVFDHDCVEAVNPAQNFRLHVPLDDQGQPVDALIYTTGKLAFKVKAPGCATVNVSHPAMPKKADEGQRKKLCCDSGH